MKYCDGRGITIERYYAARRRVKAETSLEEVAPPV
jgi:hypothetical protein